MNSGLWWHRAQMKKFVRSREGTLVHRIWQDCLSCLPLSERVKKMSCNRVSKLLCIWLLFSTHWNSITVNTWHTAVLKGFIYIPDWIFHDLRFRLFSQIIKFLWFCFAHSMKKSNSFTEILSYPNKYLAYFVKLESYFCIFLYHEMSVYQEFSVFVTQVTDIQFLYSHLFLWIPLVYYLQQKVKPMLLLYIHSFQYYCIFTLCKPVLCTVCGFTL